MQLRSGGHAFRLRVAGGWIDAERGEAQEPDLTLAGLPRDVIAALVVGEAGEEGVEIEGDREALEALRAMVVLPERLREPLSAVAEPARRLGELGAVVELADANRAGGSRFDAEAAEDALVEVLLDDLDARVASP